MIEILLFYGTVLELLVKHFSQSGLGSFEQQSVVRATHPNRTVRRNDNRRHSGHHSPLSLNVPLGVRRDHGPIDRRRMQRDRRPLSSRKVLDTLLFEKAEARPRKALPSKYLAKTKERCLHRIEQRGTRVRHHWSCTRVRTGQSDNFHVAFHVTSCRPRLQRFCELVRKIPAMGITKRFLVSPLRRFDRGATSQLPHHPGHL
jgi:hypothetical protein